jgi:tetratricopeptide (TPR) repeat protein
MVEKILFSMVALLLFLYVFAFKLIKKNDTTYLVILVAQAIGILLNFIEIIFNIFNGMVSKIVMYFLCLIIPVTVFILEYKEINFSELIRISASKILLLIGKRKKAKEILIKLVSKYDKSYMGHKMLAEIYEQEGGMRKAIDEYVKVLDIRGNDYKSYFKISKLLKELNKNKEAIEMLTILVKKKPELYEANKMLRRLIN